MMTRPGYLVTGVFVLVLTGAFIAGVLWLSAGGAGKAYDEYQVYMQESVSGLAHDSIVKYYGVEVGRVREISLGRGETGRVRLLLQINKGTPIRTDTVARLETQGLTGLSYVNLSGGSDDAPLLAGASGEGPPEIRSEPSMWNRLETVVEQLLANLVDVSARLSSLVSDANQEALTDVLRQVDELTAALASRSRVLTDTIDDTAATAANARAASERLPRLVERFEGAANSLENMARQVGAAGDTVRQTVEARDQDIEEFMAQTLPEISIMVHDLRLATESLRRFSEKLERDPQVLIRGSARGQPGPGE